MTAFSKNISNTVSVFGGSLSRWGEIVWGVDTWGDGGSLNQQVQKVISNSQSFTFDYANSRFSKAAFSIGSLSAGFEVDTSAAGQGNWTYVVPGRGYDENWSSVASAATSFTCQAAAGTSWSEA